jgi:hypothetical protein
LVNKRIWKQKKKNNNEANLRVVSVSSADWWIGTDLKSSLPEENYHYNYLLRNERPGSDYKLGTGVSL